MSENNSNLLKTDIEKEKPKRKGGRPKRDPEVLKKIVEERNKKYYEKVKQRKIASIIKEQSTSKNDKIKAYLDQIESIKQDLINYLKKENMIDILHDKVIENNNL